MLGAPFWIEVVEDNKTAPALGPKIGYLWNWDTTNGYHGSPSGGTTHEATQEGDAAILPYKGMAVSWVTTLDDASTPARVVCDEQRDPQGNFIPCADLDTDDPTPGTTDRNQQVAWTSNKWNQESTENQHTVRIISDDSSVGFDNNVDVDALIIVHRW